MRFIKNTSVYLVILVVLFFAAGLVQAGDVVQKWVARYNGPGNGYDYATAIAVDSSGNIYVTGYSTGSGTGYDYATIKYDQNGNQKWVARYNGLGNGYDLAYAIALDGSGNIYVTGQSIGSGTGCDYATIKYDPNGNQKWVARYNGPGNDFDAAFAIALDSSGNIYVTGQSIDFGTFFDYATIKYDPNGNEMWVARYNGPGNGPDYANAIAVDSSGNVYVTGFSLGSDSGPDYATIKYDPNGNEMWVARYNGPGNDFDAAFAIALDSSGNIYVTGQSIDFGTFFDYATIKYDPNGNEMWVARYNGPGNGPDCANAIAVDNSGNVYVTGSSYSSDTGDDYATLKYDTDGNQIWVARYNATGNGYDYATDIAVDGSGNVYVTGYSYGSGTNADYATVKYDTNGNELEVARYNGPPQANAIALDSSGHVYVTGCSSDGDYATIKYGHGCSVPSWCDGADTNKDGRVDLADFEILVNHWLDGADSN